ncbi:4F2 cell-surface antigen heavy chain-like isoform X2 [Portunus trituberculatus]|uniref:4F2 cell-surface antigen heavy chain-like isoform X2 n=1 Tax=Portunus trituberculatus TaxID=210409 RepID=UPI001E1CC9CA|nr:4F2 cell-surface antigen heavy chain-like isoform X2 [Portunus trituberculatus]
MTEEKNGLTHGSANSEMAPQEDGTKVPLTDEAGVKFSSNNPPNGDAKINIASGPTFSGLTKEELMKYADDPFWVRLRWILFMLFWAGWLAMLVMAIVIIIQTPRCTPKENLEWVQESAILRYDINHPMDIDGKDGETPEDLLMMAKDLGVETVYIEDLISKYNFEHINKIYDSADALAVLKAAKHAHLHIVTDFVESPVYANNTWRQNPNMSDFFNPPGSENFDFFNKGLLDQLIELFSTTWSDRGVLGYMANIGEKTPKNATDFISSRLKDVNGAVVSGMVDVNYKINDFTPEVYREFLENHIGNKSDIWSYFQFNPKLAESTLNPSKAKLVTMTLFLVPGTPVLVGIEKDYFMAEKKFIKSLSQFREKESVQIGNMNFVNTTSEEVMAFARMPVKKGTPGCAVAVNFHSRNSTEVDFSNIKGVPEKGDVHIKVTNGIFASGEIESMDLSKVVLQPLEGLVVLFVPDL